MLSSYEGFSQGTIEAYWLNNYRKGLILFLRQRGKFEVEEVTRADIQANLGYLAAGGGNSNATRGRNLAAIKSFFNIVTNAEYFVIEAHKRGTLTIATETVGNIIRASFADDGSMTP